MVYIKTILIGNFQDIDVYVSEHWDDNNNLIPAGYSKTAKAIVMPWNMQKDRLVIEAGAYRIDDLKAYTKDKLHESSEEIDIIYKGEKYKAKYIRQYNENDTYFYGLKKVIL